MKKIFIIVCFFFILKNSTASPVNVSRETFIAYGVSIAKCTIEVPSVVRLANISTEDFRGSPYQELSYTKVNFFIGYDCSTNNKASFILTSYYKTSNGCLVTRMITEEGEMDDDDGNITPLLCIYNGSQKLNFLNNSVKITPNQSGNTELSVIAAVNKDNNQMTEGHSLLFAGAEMAADLNIKILLE